MQIKVVVCHEASESNYANRMCLNVLAEESAIRVSESWGEDDQRKL
jgi:hypothetical protein